MNKILDEVTVTLFERVEQENSRDKDKSKKIRERKKKERKGRKVSRCLSRIDGRLAAADRV